MAEKPKFGKTTKTSAGPSVSKAPRPQPTRESARSKSTSSLTKKSAAENKTAPISRQSRLKPRVELLSVPEDKSQQPQVRVERASSVGAADIPFPNNVAVNKPPTLTATEAHCHSLGEPRLQSSLAVLEVLNRMKTLKIDNGQLLQKALRDDQKTRHEIEKKALRATNVDPRTSVFHHLEPLDVNGAELVKAVEKRRTQLAAHIAPRYQEREAEPKLEDFAEPYVVPLKPLLPDVKNFDEELMKFGLNPSELVTDRVRPDDLLVFRMIA